MARTPAQEARYQDLLKKHPMSSAREQSQQRVTSYDPNNPHGFAEHLAQTPLVQGILGAGDALSNMLEGIRTTATGQQFNPIKTGEGMAYGAGHIAGEVAPYFIPGTALGRVALGAGLGYTGNPEDRLGGAAMGTLFGAGGEALPYVAKGIGTGTKWIGNKFTRKEDLKAISDKLQDLYQSSKSKGSEILERLTKDFGHHEINPNSIAEIKSFFEPQLGSLNKLTKNAYDDFISKPTLSNAQRLQSKAGEFAAKIDDFKIKSDLRGARNSVIDAMEGGFEQAAPYAKDLHGDFRRYFREGVYPFEENALIDRLVHGGREGITPKTLSTNLNKLVEGERSLVPPESPAREWAQSLTDKLKRTELYNIPTNFAAGTALGAPFGPMGMALATPLGALSALGGKKFGASAAGAGFDALTNEQLINGLQKAGSFYPFVKPAIQAYPNMGENQ